MDLIKFINEIKQMMFDYPDRYKNDKREAYRDMDLFVNDCLSPTEILTITDNMEYLIESTRNKLSKEGAVLQTTMDFYPKEIAGMYLMLVRTNKEQTLNISQSHLFLVVQLFGGTNYFKYASVMKALLDQRIINAISECLFSNYLKLYGVLSELVDTVGQTDNLDIDDYLNKFIKARVDYNLCIPNEEKNNNPILIQYKENIAFLKDTILRAEKVNQDEYDYFRERMMILDTANNLSTQSMQKYLEYDDSLHRMGKKRWDKTRLELTLLNIMNHIQIENLSLEEITLLVDKMSMLLPDNYHELLSSNYEHLK